MHPHPQWGAPPLESRNVNRPTRTLWPLAILALAACEPSTSESLVARAGDYQLSVGEVVEILGPREQLPNQPQVVQALADLWIDYTLLADAAAEDSTFAGVAVDRLVEQQVEGQMILRLRDEVIDADTTVTDDELRTLFAEQAPGAQVRARHILLSYPSQASPEQRAAVQDTLRALRARIEAGEDFADLAREYSVDRGTAERGGDLGFFGRTDMVKPFADAAFALGEGEMSDPVESPYGVHLIRVEEKRAPSFDDARETFRRQVQAQRLQAAESTFIAGIEGEADPQVESDAVETVRELARDPATALSPRARNRTLVRFRGGTLTVGEVLAFLQTRNPQYLSQVVNAPPEAIQDGLLMALTQRALLLDDAAERGLEPSAQVRDSLAGEVRSGMAEAAQVLGLADLTPGEAESTRDAIQTAVSNLLVEIVNELREPIPLGPLSLALRDNARVEVFTPGVQTAVRRIEEIRGSPTPMPAPAPADTAAAPPATPDTAGG